MGYNNMEEVYTYHPRIQYPELKVAAATSEGTEKQLPSPNPPLPSPSTESLND